MSRPIHGLTKSAYCRWSCVTLVRLIWYAKHTFVADRWPFEKLGYQMVLTVLAMAHNTPMFSSPV